MTTVGLCMIVKDEAQVIERCLASVRDHIDHWLVIDTGSTDDTAEIVQRVLADVPGRLYHRPFVDFGYNRTEAVQAARVAADYTLLLDADEMLITTEDFVWPDLETDVVEVVQICGNHSRRHTALLSNRRSWQFHGVLFEQLVTTPEDTRSVLADIVIRELKDGSRHTSVSPIERNTLDARVIEAALRDDPQNLHYRYRLAGCYRDSNRAAKALEAYAERVTLDVDRGEVADSLLQVAHLLQRSGTEPDLVIAAYLNAWEAMPTRAEPLTYLAGFAREQGKFSLARLVSQRALEITPPPLDVPYVDEAVYRWRSVDEYAVASYWTGHVVESAIASRDLIARGVLPDSELARVEQNLRFARTRCEEAGLTIPPGPTAGVPEPAAPASPSSAGPPAAPPTAPPSAPPTAPATDPPAAAPSVPAPAGRAPGASAGVSVSGTVMVTPSPAGSAGDPENRIPVPMTALDDKAHQFRGLAPALAPENV
jgi:tetratricopeptide (TPR) repeat protein